VTGCFASAGLAAVPCSVMIGDEKMWNWRVCDRIALEAEAGRLELEGRLVNVEDACVGGKIGPNTSCAIL
jgi:hypothetical protein